MLRFDRDCVDDVAYGGVVTRRRELQELKMSRYEHVRCYRHATSIGYALVEDKILVGVVRVGVQLNSVCIHDIIWEKDVRESDGSERSGA